MPVILFVCTGNTCRSPMAQMLAESYSEVHGKKKYKYFSRGINVIVPKRAEKNAIQVLMTNYDLFLNNHIARQLTEVDLKIAEFVITMTLAHKKYLLNAYPLYEKKIFTLSEFSSSDTGDIADPYGGDLYEYTKCAEQIYSCIQNFA